MTDRHDPDRRHIFRDLEERRLDALYRKDEEAFRALFANEAYLERSLGAFEVVEFQVPPDDLEVILLQVILDEPECLVGRIRVMAIESLGSEADSTVTSILEPVNTHWGFSYAYSELEGWKCDGPHPLGS